jgi:chromosome partitioning protein
MGEAMSRSNTPDNSNSKSPEEHDVNRDVNTLFSTFRLDQSNYRTFNRHRVAKTPEPIQVADPEVVSRNLLRIGVFSPCGGSGKTTLTANLGSTFWQQEKRVLLVDASPWPALAFHYGAASSRTGTRSFYAPDGKELPIRIFVPERSENLFSDLNQAVKESSIDYLFFDLSGVTGIELCTYLQQCQIMIVPLLPDASALRHVETVNAILAHVHAPSLKVLYLLNEMEDTPLTADVQQNLSQHLGDQLFPKTIDRQAEVQEALAEGISVTLYAPASQASAVCRDLANGLKIGKAAKASRAQLRWSER